MKKILLLVPSLCIGGQEKIAINTYNCLKDQYDVSFAIFQRKDIEYEHPCEMINLDIPANDGIIRKIWNQFRRIIRVARLRRKLDVDVVMSFGMTANITNCFTSIISRGKSIAAIHGFAGVKKSLILSLVLRCCDAVICIAKAMKEEVLRLYPTSKNVVVVENGYDIEQIICKANDGTMEGFTHPVVLSIGRLEDVKGFDRLIKAVAYAKKECPSLKLAIMGEGKQRSFLEELAREKDVAESVSFLGHQSNPYCYLKTADLFVLSSRSEGFPNSLIEALACKCPIVSVDCKSGPREILSEIYSSAPVQGILEEKYGVLVENSDSEEQIVEFLSKAILLLINSEEKRSRYRNNGETRANQFNNEIYKNKIINIIESFDRV